MRSRDHGGFYSVGEADELTGDIEFDAANKEARSLQIEALERGDRPEDYPEYVKAEERVSRRKAELGVEQ